MGNRHTISEAYLTDGAAGKEGVGWARLGCVVKDTQLCEATLLKSMGMESESGLVVYVCFSLGYLYQ